MLISGGVIVSFLLWIVPHLPPHTADGVPEGCRQGSGSGLEAPTQLRILEGSGERGRHLVPSPGEGAERLADLLLAWAILIRHFPVGLLEPIAEFAHLVVNLLPGLGLAPARRIGLVRLHLLDGTYELFRNHHGRPDPVIARDGHDIRATLGIIQSTLALLREPGVTHLAASFDTVIESFRNEMFAGYKSSVGMPEELLRQFPFAEDALEAIGVVVWRNIEFEADDAIASAAIRWVDDVDQVVIVSPDKDMSQVIVADRIVSYNRREQKIMDEDAVVEKFGIHPESIPDYLALVGDSADGVPGLPGWGAKSTATVLARWGRLELIPDDPADWDVVVRGADKLAAVLRERRREVMLYRTLTTLRRDVPLEETLEDLEWKGPDEERSRAVAARWGI